MKKINLFIVAVFFALVSSAQATSDFENLSLGTDTFWTGSDLSGGFGSGHAVTSQPSEAAMRERLIRAETARKLRAISADELKASTARESIERVEAAK